MADRSTIYEVARRSGVSTATVSRVMADGTGFSAATRERVKATAAELGWVPSGSARGLASRRTGIVGLIFPDLGQSGVAEEESPLYVDQVIRGAERAATSVGDAVLIAATQTASGRDLAFSVAGKVDGLVVLARSLPDDDIVALSRSVPVVLLATCLARSGPDVGQALGRITSARTTTAADHVRSPPHLIPVHGHADLAFLAGPGRVAGLRGALRRVPRGAAGGWPARACLASGHGLLHAGRRRAGGARPDRRRAAPAGHRVRQ